MAGCGHCGVDVPEDQQVVGENEESSGAIFCSEEHRLVFELRQWAATRGVPGEPEEPVTDEPT